MASQGSGQPRVLLVEDDNAHAVLIQDALAPLSPRVSRVGTAKEAFALLDGQDFDLALVDVGLPDASGFELHRWAQGRATSPPIIFVTADDTLEHAVEALRTGAVHYVVKRRNYLQRLLEAVTEAIGRPEMIASVPMKLTDLQAEIVGTSAKMEEVRKRIVSFGATNATVLICGETGSGKELVARQLHRSSSRRNSRFVAINCAGINDSLLESAIIQVSGGESLEPSIGGVDLQRAAKGGTLFLDEVGDASRAVQAKLLRLLETRTADSSDTGVTDGLNPRIIAATKTDLERGVAVGDFRRDLYHRLNALRIDVPPLRERRIDIPLLAQHFLRVHARRGSTPILRREAIVQLMSANWEGNVRQLENTIQRTLASWTTGPIYCCDLGSVIDDGSDSKHGSVERQDLVALLLHYRGHLGPVARRFGVSVRTVQRRMVGYGLALRDFRRVN